MNTHRTALVTGANSGLGFEAARQLAEQGYRRVVLTARSEAKANAARDQLRQETGKDVFATLVLDLGDHATVEEAATTMAKRGGKIDLLLLNAGLAPGKEMTMTANGVEATVAASLVGHHLFTMRLLEHELLAEQARIVIAGSEAARGDVPTFKPVDVDAFANSHFSGDLEAAIETQMRMAAPAAYKPGDTYATTKLFVAWWAAELAQRLPAGMTVNAVSPGSTPDTNAIRNAPFFMKYLMLPMFRLIPGMSHTIDKGAGRYLEVAGYGPEVTGEFFASAPGKMTGPLASIRMAHFDNPPAQRALWNVTSKVAGGVNYPDPVHA
jgi:NAD(P)-dependent dehydrogenase (short-subunit alcohol dehydrogenase family)